MQQYWLTMQKIVSCNREFLFFIIVVLWVLWEFYFFIIINDIISFFFFCLFSHYFLVMGMILYLNYRNKFCFYIYIFWYIIFILWINLIQIYFSLYCKYINMYVIILIIIISFFKKYLSLVFKVQITRILVRSLFTFLVAWQPACALCNRFRGQRMPCLLVLRGRIFSLWYSAIQDMQKKKWSKETIISGVEWAIVFLFSCFETRDTFYKDWRILTLECIKIEKIKQPSVTPR